LRGSVENITECAGLLRDFISSNYIVEVKFEQGDGILLSRKDSILSALNKEGEVKTQIVRSRNIIEIRGKQNKAKDAAEKVTTFLYGGDGITVLRVSIPQSIIGALIGKGGSNISKLEKEHEGVKIDVNSTTCRLTIRGKHNVAYSCRGTVLKELVNVYANESIKVNLDVIVQLSDKRCIRKITGDLPVNVTLTASLVKLRGNYVDVEIVKAAVEELSNGTLQGQVDLSSPLFDALRSNVETKTLFDTIQNENTATIEMDEQSSSIRITGKRSFVKRVKFFIFDHLVDNYSHCFSKLGVPKHLAKVASNAKAVTAIAAETGCDIVFDSDVHTLLMQSESSERLAQGLERAKEYVKKCDSYVFVVNIDRSDSWLLVTILTQYRDSLRDIEETCNCKLEVLKDELVISISVKGGEDVQDGKEAVLALVETVKAEIKFVDIPESSMPQFIGQSSKHINAFAAMHSVQIERVRKSPTRLCIHGQPAAVKNAAVATEEWISGWEDKNAGTSVKLDKGTLEIFNGNTPSSEKRKISRNCGVKLDVYLTKSTVIIRGGKGNAHDKAIDAIKALACIHHEEVGATEPSRQPTVSIDKAPPAERVKITVLIPAKKESSIPTMVEKKGRKEAANKKDSKSQTVSKLFNFLVSEDDEPWDASTVSSGLENSEDGYFRSSSGFSVRL
jgi:rRNA processing protein Krr1/Pno1